MRAMTEPASSTAAGFGAYKLLAGAGFASFLAGVVVMCMTPPRSAREWPAAIISTVVVSVCGGAAVVQHFGLQAWAHEFTGMVALIGLCFVCGLPAWLLVRAAFAWFEKRRDMDLGQLGREAAEDVRAVIGGSNGD